MTPPRVIYDTMVFVQWALLPPGRQHKTTTFFEQGRIELCMSPALAAEIARALRYPELRGKAPHLTDKLIDAILNRLRTGAVWFDSIPHQFSHAVHGDDDHIFDLAIAARALYLVTWEARHLEMARKHPDDARRLRGFAPQLRIISPSEFARELLPEV